MKTALLVIDAQRIYTSPGSELYCENAESSIKNINELIQVFRSNQQAIIFVRHIHKKDGSDLGRMFDYLGEEVEEFDFVEGTEEVEYDEAVTKESNDYELIKTRYSAFVGTELERVLREKGIARVVITGFMTNFCCESTARDAHDRDFYVDFIVDATGTPGTENLEQPKIREVVAEFLEEGYARILTTEEFVKNPGDGLHWDPASSE